MGKKINYFDDDYDEQAERANQLNDFITKKRSEIKQRDSEENKSLKLKSGDIGTVIKQTAVFLGRYAKDIAHNVAEKIRRDDDRRGYRLTLLIVATILVLVIMVSSVTVSFIFRTDKNEKFCNDAGKVCADYIIKYGNCSYENLYTAYNIVGYRMTGLCYARQMDFDNDGNDELFVCYNDSGEYYTEVWGYNNDKKFISLFHEKATQSDDITKDAWVTIYYKNNKYYIGIHDKNDITKVDLYQLKGEEFEKKRSCTYDEQLEAFVIKDKVQYNSFERIRFSVLNEKKAIVTANLISDIIDDFTTEQGLTNAANSGKSLKSAYNEIVQNHLQAYGAPSYKTEDGYSYIDGLAFVKQVDFDGDDTNELLLMYRKAVRVREEDYNGNYVATTKDTYYCEVYKYNGKKAVMVYQKDSVSNLLNDQEAAYVILKKAKNKTYLCTNSFSSENYGRIVNARSNVLKFDGERLVPHRKSSYYNEYGYTQYYIDDERVYRNEFRERGYGVPFFDGEESYDESVYDVIFLQQKTDDAVDMESQISATTTEISKLK